MRINGIQVIQLILCLEGRFLYQADVSLAYVIFCNVYLVCHALPKQVLLIKSILFTTSAFKPDTFYDSRYFLGEKLLIAFAVMSREPVLVPPMVNIAVPESHKLYLLCYGL